MLLKGKCLQDGYTLTVVFNIIVPRYLYILLYIYLYVVLEIYGFLQNKLGYEKYGHSFKW